MNFGEKFKQFLKIIKVGAVLSGGTLFIAYNINETYKRLNRIVNPKVLETEKKFTPEYIYIDDPSYGINLKKEQDKEKETWSTIGIVRIWKSLKQSLAWRLLWLCRHGNREQRNIALVQLAAIKNNKDWDCLKLAQAMDKNTAVLLARTYGADLRYFLPPPIHIRRSSLSSELLSFKLKEMISAIHKVNPHSCIQHFLSKYFVSVQDHAMEADSIPRKPNSVSERELCIQCLDALHHHLSLFYNKTYENDTSVNVLIKMGLLPKLAELFLRNRGDSELDVAVLGVLTILSSHSRLLNDFFYNGLIGELTRLIKSKDVRISSSAAVCLANLSGEHCFRPGLYLLHPIYRTTMPHTCDTLLVHGLRGGVFVTWRQRDKSCVEPLGIREVSNSNIDYESQDKKADTKYMDPELQQVMEDLIEMEEETLLSEYEVALCDLPIQAEREPPDHQLYLAKKKRLALIQEQQDKNTHTYCWPKDWLPKDCNNIRVLGINYITSLSDWLESCPMQSENIEMRAASILPKLIDAGIGKENVPLVWLAHSMGGIIVKQVLINSALSNDFTFKKVCENTKALFFYSTPHKGSSLAKLHRAVAAVLWPSNDVRQLKENSPVLLEIHKTFIKFAEEFKWEIVSFVETKPTLITAFKVPIHFVYPHSADLGCGALYQLPLDHLCICKPATRQSILYTAVLNVLDRIVPNECDLNHSCNIFTKIWNFFKCGISKKAKEIMESVDHSPTSSNLNWFDRLLLDAFTDGFTD